MTVSSMEPIFVLSLNFVRYVSNVYEYFYSQLQKSFGSIKYQVLMPTHYFRKNLAVRGLLNSFYQIIYKVHFLGISHNFVSG